MGLITLFSINILLSTCNIGLYELEIFEKDIYWTLFIINLVLFFTMLGKCAVQNSKALMSLFLLVFGHVFALVSCFLGEYYEEFLIEVNTIAYFKGASLWLLFYSILYIGTAYISFDENYHRQNDVRSNIVHNDIVEYVITAISVGCIFSMILCLLINGSPLFSNIVRFDYWISVPWFFKKIFLLLTMLPLYFGMTFTSHKMRNTVLLITTIIISILCADKFSGLFNILFLFVFGYIVSNDIKIKFTFKTTIKIVGISTIIIWIIYETVMYHYTNFSGGFAGHSGLQAIYYRVLGQGQVAYYFLSQTNFHIYEFIHEVTNWFVIFPDSLNLGMYKLMGAVGADVNAAAARSIRLSMAFPSIIIYYLGSIISIPIIVLIGYLVGKIYYRFFAEVKNNNIINSILLYRIVMLSFEAFGMGNLHRFFSLECTLYFIIYYLYNNYKINME